MHIQVTDEAIQALTVVLRNLLDMHCPWKFVCMSSRDPKHMTPLLKILSAKQDRHIKKHRYQDAKHINMQIREKIFTQFRQNDSKTVLRHWWDRVNELSEKSKSIFSTIDFKVNELNNLFPIIDRTDSYEDLVLAQISLNDSPQVDIHQLCYGLKNIKLTAFGADGIFFWVLKKKAHNLAEFFYEVFNKIINVGAFPQSWNIFIVCLFQMLNHPRNVRTYAP